MIDPCDNLRRRCDSVSFALIVALLCLMLSPRAALSVSGDDLRSIELYNGAASEVVSGSRSPRPASQSAENITVVTADEIASLNAHTLGDLLAYVTGVQLEMIRTPGTTINFRVQGANFNHVLVLLDGVPLNNLADNVTMINAVPVQMIERVEIVKGAASSSWGNALGGVINVITKLPDQERPLGGVVSGSYGSRQTADLRGELSGTLDRFGYYLSAGRLRSDGLLEHNMVDKDNLYLKFNYDLPARGSLALTTFLNDGDHGMFGAGGNTGDADDRLRISTLSAQYPLSDHLKLEAALMAADGETELTQRGMRPGGVPFARTFSSDEARRGAQLKLSWLDELQRIVAGVDYEHVKAHVAIPIIQADLLNRSTDRIGVYLSDTITLGRFAITPSARYDSTGSGGDHFSPSLGITYALSDNTVLRGYSAKGYGLTSLNRDNSTEKVWTSQVGFESGELPYLWLKGTLFRNDIWDVRSDTLEPTLQRELRQGFELEGRTLAVWDTSLSAGYTFMRATLGEHGAPLVESPRHTLQMGVRYRNPEMLQAELNGRYIDWRAEAGSYGSVIWDLHLGKTFDFERTSLELFLSVRNLLDDDQYLDPIYVNTGRWAEAGVRCNF